jgi:hypothetical protein
MNHTRLLACLFSFTLVCTITSFAQVIISEIVADNTKFDDEDTDSPSWFELYNPDSDPVALDGWHLTNDSDDLSKWTIQQLTLEGKSVRVFFASGKDRPLTAETINGRFLHTNFGLPNKGGYLALVKPDGTTIADTITYPALEKNLAYSRSSGETGYLFPASPNQINSGKPKSNGLTPTVVPSHSGGILAGPIELTLEVPDHPEANIQYSLTSADPSAFTPTYSGPITIDKSTTMRIKATLPGHLSSRIIEIGFLVMDETLTNFVGTGKIFDSNIPVMVIDSFGANLTSSRAFKPAYSVVISPDPETGRASLTGKADYAGPSAAHLRGESSAGFGQKSYALELRDADGEDHDAALLGMPADSDWAIYGPWSEKSLMRNKLIFDWMRALRGADGTSMRTRFVEIFINQRESDTIGYDAYQGVHVLMEKIKINADRVPIGNLNEHTIDPDMITGGYIFRKDKTDSGKNNWRTSGGFGIPLQSFDPDRFNDVQLEYLQDYINRFERTLKGDDFIHPTKGYRTLMDTSSFIDAQWMLEISKQVDGYVFSTYWHKPRNGKLRAGPLWDFNISLGNASYATGETPTGWYQNSRNGRGQLWYPRLHEDPEYKMAHWDRYWHMRQTILSDKAIDATIDGHMNTLLDGYSEPVGNREPDRTNLFSEGVQNPVARHFRKYPYIGRVDWPNPAAERKLKTYQDEIDYLKTWLKDRLEWMDDESFDVDGKVHRAPLFSQLGGELDTPIDLTMTRFKGGLFDANKYAQGSIYYTTDGSDPRLEGGELNPAALIYERPLAIEHAITVTARLLNGDIWTPRTSATYRLGTAPVSMDSLVISEIMYHPADPSPLETFGGFHDGTMFEYLELTNVSDRTIDLTGLAFSKGINFDFAGVPTSKRLIPLGTSFLLVSNREGFAKRHRDVDESIVLGEYTGKLSNAGERLSISDTSGEELVTVKYDDGGDNWPAEADGEGFSLTLTSLEEDLWVASAEMGGTPGEATLSGPDGVDGSDPLPSATADSDRDGLSDLAEFALGSDPKNASSVNYPRVSIFTEGNADYLAYSYMRNAEATDFNYVIEVSNDLTAWQALDSAVLLESKPQANTVRESYRTSEPVAAGSAPRFARLRAIAP